MDCDCRSHQPAGTDPDCAVHGLSPVAEEKRRARQIGFLQEMVSLRITRQELSALQSILVDHILRQDSTQQWEDVLSGTVVTCDDLLRIVSDPEATR